MPALAAVESPDEDDVLSFPVGATFAVGFAFVDAVDAVADEASDPEAVLELKTPTAVPNNCMAVTPRILSVRLCNLR
jgi:hypothetical protein